MALSPFFQKMNAWWKKLSGKQADPFKESLAAFQNRTIHGVLTLDILMATPDEELLQIVFDNLSDKMGDYQQEAVILREQFNPSQQAIYLSWWLEAEVHNGGFNQFYVNSKGPFAEMIPELLEGMNAMKFAKLTRKANQTYQLHQAQITQRQDGTLEGFSQSYQDNPLNELDQKFYDLYEQENLFDLQVAFIRKHQADFVD
ncbi:MAG: DUF4375 domain-containing protein [Bacteroidota bacterium]